MAITSVWFLSDARVMRVDELPDGLRWSRPMPVERTLPALAAIGVSQHKTGRRVGGGFAIGPHDVALDALQIDLAKGGATVAWRSWRSLRDVIGLPETGLPTMSGLGTRGIAVVPGAGLLDALGDRLLPIDGELTYTVTATGKTQELFTPAVRFASGRIVAFRGEGPFQSAGVQVFDPQTKTTDGVVIPFEVAFPQLADAAAKRGD